MKIKKLGALLVSVALCAGMAAPAFAYGGEPVEEVEQPVLTSTTDEEDVVTVTDEETGALTPEGNLTLVDDYQRLPHRLFRWQRSAVHYAGVEVGCDFLSGD
ncbi:hypothetical protein FBDF15_24740 [Faecalibacterium duncaniae]